MIRGHAHILCGADIVRLLRICLDYTFTSHGIGYSVIDQPKSRLNFLALPQRNEWRRGMSPANRSRKNQSRTGRRILDLPVDIPTGPFAQVIADALHREFGGMNSSVKTVVNLTHANERAVKNWFLAKNGPTGQHLVDLLRASDEVLVAVLLLSGRRDLVLAKTLADSKQVLIKMLNLIGRLL
jgi:hypothetical protein